MKNSILSFARRAYSDQRGQTLPFVALGMVALLGMGGLVVDVGHAYVVRSQLQNSANAAALAASGAVYNSQSNTVNYTSLATQYNCGSGAENASSGVTCTQTFTPKCFNSLMPPGENCTGAPNNAVVVQNTANVKTYLMGLFGVPALNVSATATASIQGTANSWNVAVIVDGTSSMSTTDTNCGNLTQFQCALSSVQVFLEHVNPGPSGNIRVSLFSFPNVAFGGGGSESNTCGGTFTGEVYTLPAPGASNYGPIVYSKTGSQIGGSYQIATWDSNYYLASATADAGLNPSDNLVKTIGAAYNTSTGAKALTGCLPNVGGETTYIASTIYAAQAALTHEQTLYANSKNAMIILSDGQANAAAAKFPGLGYTATNGGIAPTYAGTTTYSASAKNLAGVVGGWGQYPDINNECQQEITAANAATAAGTVVYTVAYGSEDTGCGSNGGTDTHLSIGTTGLNVPFTALSQLTPCLAMEDMASTLNDFYSDPNQSGSNSTCADGGHTTATLADISLAIAANFTKPRLIPNNAN